MGRRTHGQRLNNDVYVQQQLTLGRLAVIAGGRFVHDSAFGNTGVPRVALTLQALRGGGNFFGDAVAIFVFDGIQGAAAGGDVSGMPGIRIRHAESGAEAGAVAGV